MYKHYAFLKIGKFMQFLIVPAVLWALWFFGMCPAFPGFAFVLLACIYLMVCVIETQIKNARAAQLAQFNQLMDRLDRLERELSRQVENVQSEVNDLTYRVNR
ncbi:MULTISPECIES: hypothetical protein [Rahnella]|uniref:hypothetical protein n=1 Tax=Rahnella TaxID=34037 RepID=UPI0010433009|nr:MULTISPECIES: hypothetical protein [Rahnella]